MVSFQRDKEREYQTGLMENSIDTIDSSFIRRLCHYTSLPTILTVDNDGIDVTQILSVYSLLKDNECNDKSLAARLDPVLAPKEPHPLPANRCLHDILAIIGLPPVLMGLILSMCLLRSKVIRLI